MRLKTFTAETQSQAAELAQRIEWFSLRSLCVPLCVSAVKVLVTLNRHSL
jgi:hypothetical protein